MLVLGGTVLFGRGLASEGSLYGELGVAAIAEIYSLLLIASAALLRRLGQRRSSVMLALLTILYQCDLTLHTETCPNLGPFVSQAATFGWILLFAVKLRALAWAMRLRISLGAYGVAMLMASGLALIPYVLDAYHGGPVVDAVIGLWLFALVRAQGFVGEHAVSTPNDEDLDAWGKIVLRRSVRATFGMWGFAGVLHVLFWSTQFRVNLHVLIPIVPLIATRFVKSEASLWVLVTTTLGFTGLVLPAELPLASLISALSLALRAWVVSQTPPPRAASEPSDVGPYRAVFGEATSGAAPAIASPAVWPVGISAVQRLVTGAIGLTYLAAWSQLAGESFPRHVALVDVVFLAVLLVYAWRTRAKIAALPIALFGLHATVMARLVPQPRSLVEWGAWAIGLGFLLLIGSILVSYLLHAASRQREVFKVDRRIHEQESH